MKVVISLNDVVEVKLTNLGALLYNNWKTKGFNKEQLKNYNKSSAHKQDGDSLRINLSYLISLFGTEAGELQCDCFYNNEISIISY